MGTISGLGLGLGSYILIALIPITVILGTSIASDVPSLMVGFLSYGMIKKVPSMRVL